MCRVKSPVACLIKNFPASVENNPYSHPDRPAGIIGNLKFALRYEPIDLSVYDALFGVLYAELLEAWIRQEPTGIYVRRAWFLYEALTGKLLDADDVSRTGYINILDPNCM